MRRLFSMVVGSSLALAACNKDEGEPGGKGEPTTGAKVTASPTPTATLAGQDVPITASSPKAVAHYEEALELQENFRTGAALDELERALAIDDGFARAHAQLANLVPGEQGERHRERAASLAADLPASERLFVEALVAREPEARAEILGRLVAKAPRDWRVQMLVAREALRRGEKESALAGFEKAAELNPEAPFPHNNLAYLYAEAGRWDRAIASADRYADLSPGEPNPLDTRAEILLMAGKLDKAEAGFRTALQLAPEFAVARGGIAMSKLYRGDWDGGVAELEKAVETAARPIERARLQNELAWALVAAGRDEAARKAFARGRELFAEAGLDRPAGIEHVTEAEIGIERERWGEARAAAERALDALAKADVPPAKRGWAQALAVIAASRAGDLGAAKKTLAAMKGAASHYRDYAAGHLALAQGEPERAAELMQRLADNKHFGARARLLRAEALAKAGKSAEAAQLRSELATTYRRGIWSVMVQKRAKEADGS